MKFPRLKDVREDADKTQKDIASLLQTTESYYNRLENGKHDITFERAVIIADYFGISLDYLAGRTNEKSIRKHTTGSIRNTSPLPQKK